MVQNIGMRFENWAANKVNYNKNIRGEKVEDFKFVDKDMATIPTEQKADYYQKNLLKLSQSRIDNYDLNRNGKMELNEYALEQATVYEKMFGEKLDFTIKGMYEMLKQNFDNADTNEDGSIDNKEMGAVFAYMDGAKDGELDGTISYGHAVGINWAKPEMKEALANLKKFLFKE